MTNEAALKKARAQVNAFKFGTPEWEAAMQVVRTLVGKIEASKPSFIHTSIDGDIWAPR